MKAILKNPSFRNNVLFLIVLGVVLYATGYQVRVYSGLKNPLIRTGIITPRTVTAVDFEQAVLNPEALSGLKLIDEQGRQVSLGDFGQEVLLINVWASWCGPCRREMPTIQKLTEKLQDKQFEIVMVNTAETEDEVFSFLGIVAPDLVPLMDTDGLVTEAWQPRGLPATFLVDPQGNLRYLALASEMTRRHVSQIPSAPA